MKKNYTFSAKAQFILYSITAVLWSINAMQAIFADGTLGHKSMSIILSLMWIILSLYSYREYKGKKEE